jgi:hypothetical protein
MDYNFESNYKIKDRNYGFVIKKCLIVSNGTSSMSL